MKMKKYYINLQDSQCIISLLVYHQRLRFISNCGIQSCWETFGIPTNKSVVDCFPEWKITLFSRMILGFSFLPPIQVDCKYIRNNFEMLSEVVFFCSEKFSGRCQNILKWKYLVSDYPMEAHRSDHVYPGSDAHIVGDWMTRVGDSGHGNSCTATVFTSLNIHISFVRGFCDMWLVR